MAKKTYEDDDGRSFADMSQVERPSFFGHIPGQREQNPKPSKPARAPAPGDEMTHQERRWYVLGTMKASLLIALAYALGLGLVVLLMVTLW